MASTPGQKQEEKGIWALGLILFAAVFMVVGGIFHALSGLAALIDDDFITRLQEYAYDFDVTAWGWLHLVIGAILVTTGAWLLTGALWARLIAGLVVIFSAMLNFVYIPYQPLWSIVLLVIDGAVLWALIAAPTFEPEVESPLDR